MSTRPAYKPVVKRLGVDHHIRAAHVKKRAWNRLDKTDGREWIKAMIWRRLTELPLDGDLELPRPERAVRDGTRRFAARAVSGTLAKGMR